jgi:hypothetical protein
MPARIGAPEMFNDIFLRIISKTIFFFGFFRALSYFFPEYFFYLGFRSRFRISAFILVFLFYFGFE